MKYLLAIPGAVLVLAIVARWLKLNPDNLVESERWKDKHTLEDGHGKPQDPHKS